jgi:ATP-dependent DNA helicase RecG
MPKRSKMQMVNLTESSTINEFMSRFFLNSFKKPTMPKNDFLPARPSIWIFSVCNFFRIHEAIARAHSKFRASILSPVFKLYHYHKSLIIDSASITDFPALAVEKALQFVQRNTRRALEIKSVRHREVWEFPAVALREAVINAFVHADYAQGGSSLRLAVFSDRIEVENPGNLPPGLTIGDILRGVSKLRNRVIGRVFHELKLIEQWGSGIQRMINACQQAGLPKPEFEEIGSGFRVTFRRGLAAQPVRDELDQAIVEFLRRNPGATTSRIAARIKRTSRTTQSRLKNLLELGQIVALGSSATDPRKGYHQKEE